VKSRFVQGYRVTDEASAEIVDRVLSREINPDVVSAIEEFGGKARGIAGPEVFRCRKFSPQDNVDLGFVGEVSEVNVEPLRECIRRSITPVISPTALGDDGKIYNCNADIAAAKTAVALKARRLVFMSDVPGLLRDPKDETSLLTHLAVNEVPKWRKKGVIGEGMIPKVDSAVAAIESGVEKVQFVDGRIPHSVLLEIFTDAGVGTEVVL
jgi:acetylglutamate kinase